MTREKLREIVCALRAISGDIVGGLFGWTDASLHLFARICAGLSLDDADRHTLARCCEIAEAIARTLHDWTREMRFDEYRESILRECAEDARELLGYLSQEALRRRRSARDKKERGLSRDFAAIAPTEGDGLSVEDL